MTSRLTRKLSNRHIHYRHRLLTTLRRNSTWAEACHLECQKTNFGVPALSGLETCGLLPPQKLFLASKSYSITANHIRKSTSVAWLYHVFSKTLSMASHCEYHLCVLTPRPRDSGLLTMSILSTMFDVNSCMLTFSRCSPHNFHVILQRSTDHGGELQKDFQRRIRTMNIKSLQILVI
jgi:hypothetical protein